MESYKDPGITFETATFRPMQIMAVRHTLSDHPLLALDKLTALAERLEPRGLVRRHNDKAQPNTNFSVAPSLHPTELGVGETLARLEDAKTWMALHNIQTDPVYRGLVDEVLDYVRPQIEPSDPGMCHRAGWIFITSPNAVTPYHIDHEHNFILQALGKKTLHVFDPMDAAILSERALELFHTEGSRDLVRYEDHFERKARVFELEPGMGGYMPTNAGHWVKNGNNVSITVSFTYFTRMTMRRRKLYQANYTLRKYGFQPRPVGKSMAADAAKVALFDAYRIAKRRARIHSSVEPSPISAPYADVATTNM